MNSTTMTATTTSGEYHLNESIEIVYEVSKWLNVVMITLVAIFGIYGNIVSIIIFANPSYNKNSINSLRVYLILLATSDLLVLIFHYLDFTFRSWVNLTGMHSARFNFVDKSVFACKLVPYLRNVFRTVSVFTLVLMTLQRFILIYFPNVQAKLGSSTFSRSVAIILILLSALFNIVTAFVNDLDQHPITGETYCSISPVYVHLQFRFDLVFVLFTILLPAVLVVCLGFILYRKIRIRYKQLKMCKATSGEPIDEDEVSEHLKQQVVEQFEEERLQKSKRLSDYLNYVNTKFPQMPNMENLRTVDVKGMQKSASTMLINGNEKPRMSNKPRQDSMNLGRQSIAISLPGSNQTSLRRNLKQSIKTTYMLLIVSKWFILLHFPYFICWCFYYVHMNKLHGRFSSDSNDIILISEWDLNKKILLKSFLQFFEILFLFNYSINFLLYFIYGPLFRKTHSKVIFKLVQNVFYYTSYCFYHCAK